MISRVHLGYPRNCNLFCLYGDMLKKPAGFF